MTENRRTIGEQLAKLVTRLMKPRLLINPLNQRGLMQGCILRTGLGEEEEELRDLVGEGQEVEEKVGMTALLGVLPEEAQLKDHVALEDRGVLEEQEHSVIWG